MTGATITALSMDSDTTVTLKNLTLSYLQLARPYGYSNSSVITLIGCTSSTGNVVRDNGDIVYTNCSLKGEWNTGSSAFARVVRSTFTGCTINGNCTFGTNRLINYINCKVYGDSTTVYNVAKLVMTGSTVTHTLKVTIGADQINQAIIFAGYNTFTGSIAAVSNSSANDTAVTYLIAGSTTNMSGNTNNSPIIGFATPGVKVGTFSDTTNYTADTWTTGGTATIITATGTTIKVSGEGTYINKDGTTDLTVVS